MENLKELSYIINKYQLRHIEIPGGSGDKKDTKSTQLFDAIITGSVDSDEDAAKYLGYSSNQMGNYRRLKGKVKRQMLNAILFLNWESPDFSERDKVAIECYKEWASARILFQRKAIKLGISLSKSTLKKAIKYEFHDIVVEIYTQFRYFFGIYQKDMKSFHKYNELYHKYDQLRQAEALAQEQYILLMSMVHDNKVSEKEVSKQAWESFNILEDGLSKYNSTIYFTFTKFIHLIHYMSVYNYEESLKICTEAVNHLENTTIGYSTKISFLMNKLSCHVQLKHYDEGRKTANQAIELAEKGTYNYFRLKEVVFMLEMHTSHYQEAYELLKEVISHKRYDKMRSAVLETWAVYKGYIFLLAELGAIQLPPDDKLFKSFRIQKFLNEVPSFSKQKRGRNIPVLILHMLLLIHKGRWDDALDRIEALEKYTGRYLKNNDTFRSSVFIKMILQIPIAGFHQKAAKRKANKYLKKLEESPLHFANQAHEVEIIPYEELWELTLSLLSNQVLKGRWNS